MDLIEILRGRPYLVYIISVLAVGALVAIWIKVIFKKIETKRRKAFTRRERYESIETETPLDNPKRVARERGVESIHARFKFWRRVLIPISVLFLMTLALVPVLDSIKGVYLSFFLGTMTVIVGIAAKPFIENLIAGLVITVGRTIRIGDTVLVDDYYGTVEEIAATYTIIKVWDWRRYIIPNLKLLEKEIINYSIIDRYQWAYVEFWVAPESDMGRVQELAVEAVRASTHFAPYEEPAFWIRELGKDGIRCWIAAWANTPADAWSLTSDTRTELVRLLQKDGIKMHMNNQRVIFDPTVSPETLRDKTPHL